MTSLTATHNTQRICQVLLSKYTLPFKSAMVFKGHTLQSREGYLVELVFADGSVGKGEIAPLPGFSKESLDDSLTQLKRIFIQLFAKPCPVSTTTLTKLIKQASLFPSVLFGLDCALAKVTPNNICIATDKKQVQQQQCKLPPKETSLLMGSLNDIISQYQSLNLPNRIKLKVGKKSPTEDASIVNQLHALNPNLRCILDANQAWNSQSADEFAKAVNHLAIAYIEEPCNNYINSINFSQQHKIAIALDETLQDSDFKFVAKPEIAAVVIKPSLIGSFSRCKSIINQALVHNMQVYISSSFESPIGIGQLQTLSTLWAPKHPLGLDTLKYQDIDSLSLIPVMTWPKNSDTVGS